MTDSGGGKVRYFCADTLKKGRYEYMHGIEFFTFPTQKKDPKGMRAWIGLLRRKDYDPPGHHRDDRPTAEILYPTLFVFLQQLQRTSE